MGAHLRLWPSSRIPRSSTEIRPGRTDNFQRRPTAVFLVADDAVYITVSDPSNMTKELESDRKKIYRYNLDGTNRKEFCSGIRNTEKLQFRPGTTEIWGCDHGSDNFGATYGERIGSNQPSPI